MCWSSEPIKPEYSIHHEFTFTESSMKSWYLLQAKPRQENVAKLNLERQGYTVYLPLAPVRRKMRGKVTTESAPMFPLYLFINLQEGTDDWGPIRSTIGIARLVRFGQIPARIPDQLILMLKSREDEKGIQRLPVKTVQPGDKVRIAAGPFEGYEAIVQATSSRSRIVLLMKVIESFIKVEIDQDSLEPVS